MTTNPIDDACRLLREGAAELKNCHTLAATGHDWTGEPEAKAAYDEHMATADALERVHAECEALRTGYAAARLEIESLRARSAEPVGEYPALPKFNAGAVATEASGKVEMYPAAFKQLLSEIYDRGAREAAGAWRAYVDADRAMRAAQPAGAQQPGTAYAAQGYEHQRAIMEAERNASLDAYSRVIYLTGAESRLYEAGFTNGWQRASHGQAPAQAAPAAVAGPSDVVSIQRQAFIRGWDERGMAHQLKGTVETDERMRVLMDIYFPRTAAPTTQPAPQQEAQSALFDKQGFRAWVLHNLPDDTIIGSSAYWADHLSAWAQRFVKKAPQQEPGKDVHQFRKQHCADWYDGRADHSDGGGPYEERTLYTSPQPSPASQGDALSQAARDVLDERQRQISAEGWTPEHDDEHLPGELSLAAASYVCADDGDAPPAIWPWDWSWWKPRNRRRNLVKSGALILAELERMDRADAARAAQEGK